MSNYKADLLKIKAIAFDVDGVLTDGSIISTLDGDLLRTFDSKDGFGIRMCKMKNIPIGIITGGESESIVKRFLAIGIEHENIFQHARNKPPFFLKFCEQNNLDPKEVAYVGDDIPDISVLKMCGLAVCPSDAVPEVKEVCDYISLYKGGKGCARDLIEQILKIHGKWTFEAEEHSKWF